MPKRDIGWLAALAVATGVATVWTGPFLAAGLVVLLIAAAYIGLLLRHPERGLWLLAIVLPYERLGTLDTGLLTLKLGHFISACIAVSLAARALLTKQGRWFVDPLKVPMLLILATMVLSLINAVDLQRSLALIIQLLIGFGVYWLTVGLLDRRNLRGTLVALWLGAAVVGVFGLYQFIGDFLGVPVSLTGLLPAYSGTINFGFARIQGPSLEPLYFANYLLLPILTAAAYLIGTCSRRRLWLIPLLLLLDIVFVLTLARGAFVGLFVSGAILAVLYRKVLLRPRVIATGLAATFVIGVAVGALLIATTNPGEKPLDVFARQIGVSGKDVSSQERIGSAQAAQSLVRDHPIIGVGVGNFGQYYQDPKARTGGRQVVNNQTLEILVETGVLGLIAWGLLVLVLTDRTVRAWRALGRDEIRKAALVGSGLAVLAILIQAQTFSAIYLMHVWFAVGMLVAVQNMILKKH